ncbi:DUF732 domain-containing protein [Amycolatopsis thermoflava]|uniref:DUF732 domain-containing protein n=1 Tax=Amycolatopsis thermoflava TaxID=84480 RepID=UPI003EBDDE07
MMTVVGLLFVVAGCGGPEPAPPTPAPTGAAGAASYLAALGAIDPALVTDPDRAVSRGKNVCLDLEAGKERATVVSNAAARFDGGSVAVDAAKAERIVAAIESSGFCSQQ